MKNHVHSVSVRSESRSETTRKNEQGISTTAHVTGSSPQGLDAQSRTPQDEGLHQSWGSLHQTTDSTADIHTWEESNLQASSQYRTSDPAGWTDSLVAKENFSAVHSVQEACSNSTVQRPPYELYSATNSGSEMTWLQQKEQQVQQEQDQIAPHPALPYVHTQQSSMGEFCPCPVSNSQYAISENHYEQSEVPSYHTTPPRTLYKQTEFHNARLYREHGYDSSHPVQDYIENFMSSSDPTYIQTEAGYQPLPQFPDGADLAVQPVRPGGLGTLPVDGWVERPVDLNLERHGVPWTRGRSALMPDSRMQGRKRKRELQQSDGSDPDSPSPEFDKAPPPRYTTAFPEPGRDAKRRRVVREPSDLDIFDHNMVWREIGSQSDAAMSQLAAVMPNDTGPAFEVPKAFEKVHRSSSVAAERRMSASYLPFAPLEGSRRGKSLRPRASQVSPQADHTDLSRHCQIIRSMYLTQGKTLVQIMEFMKIHHGVVAR
jgi:hypothetical protein